MKHRSGNVASARPQRSQAVNLQSASTSQHNIEEEPDFQDNSDEDCATKKRKKSKKSELIKINENHILSAGVGHLISKCLFDAIGSLNGRLKGAKGALANVGISIGAKTSRDRLLELLGQHIKHKRVKCDLPPGPVRRSQLSTSHVRETTDSPKVDFSIVTPIPKPPKDYNEYEECVLKDMLKVVGLDTQRMKKEELVKLCWLYHDLSECVFDPLYHTFEC